MTSKFKFCKMIKIPNYCNLTRNQVLHYCSCKVSTNKDVSVAVKHDEKAEEIKKQYSPKGITTDDLKWRSEFKLKEQQNMSFLRAFYSKKTKTSALQKIQAPIDLSPSAVNRWWVKKKEEYAKLKQAYIPERNITLGNELAAAHFIVYRGGSVKFQNENDWIKADENKEYNLPNKYREDKILQAIDCTDMDLYYEGLMNLRHLEKVEWLSLNGCEHMDDWCLDVISNIFSHSLLYLDLRNCPKITSKGLGALYKLERLKILYLDDFLKSTQYELTCLLLQEVNPTLDIRSDQVTFEIK